MGIYRISATYTHLSPEWTASVTTCLFAFLSRPSSATVKILLPLALLHDTSLSIWRFILHNGAHHTKHTRALYTPVQQECVWESASLCGEAFVGYSNSPANLRGIV